MTLGANSASGFTRLTFAVFKQDALSIECGLCNGVYIKCIKAPQSTSTTEYN